MAGYGEGLYGEGGYGVGLVDYSGGSTVIITIVASGDGYQGFSGGSTAEVITTTNVGGSVVVMTVVSTGRGRHFRIDLDVEIGPTYVFTRDVGPSRTGFPVGPSRIDRGI